MSSFVEQYTLYQIANAPLRKYPYPHYLVHDVFEPELYRQLLEHLLPPELMQPIKQVRPVGKGYSDERFVFTLGPQEIAALPARYCAFWEDLSGWLLGMPFLSSLFRKFAPYIEQRFGDQDPGFYNEAMLVDDRVRYSLGPHSDAPSKVITLLFYLPADAARPHLGTSIYVPRNPEFRCAGGPHYPYEVFKRVMTMPYLPNTLFAFFKTDNSFHGVEPVRDENYRRHLLFYDVKCDLSTLKKADPVEQEKTPAAAARPRVEFTF